MILNRLVPFEEHLDQASAQDDAMSGAVAMLRKATFWFCQVAETCAYN